MISVNVIMIIYNELLPYIFYLIVLLLRYMLHKRNITFHLLIIQILFNDHTKNRINKTVEIKVIWPWSLHHPVKINKTEFMTLQLIHYTFEFLPNVFSSLFT